MQLEVKIVPVNHGGTDFVAEPGRLHLGGKGAEKVDGLHFVLPEAWAGLTVSLYIEWKSGEMPAPAILEADGAVPVTRSFTGALAGRWMLMAVGENGYKAFSRPAPYDCYDVLETDAGNVEIAPTLYEQFVNQVLSYANSALNSSKEAAASAAKVQVDQEQMDRYVEAAAASAKEAAQSEDGAATSETNAAESERIAAKYMEQVKMIATGANGYYATPEELRTEVPIGSDGWWAVVGSTNAIWVWDSSAGDWVDSSDNAAYIPYDLLGVPGGLASLDANGKLPAGQLPAIDHYTQAEADSKISDAVSTHNSAADAHPAIQASLNLLKATVQAIELKYGTSIKENAFQVSFENLDSVNVTGVWNQPLATIEF